MSTLSFVEGLDDVVETAQVGIDRSAADSSIGSSQGQVGDGEKVPCQHSTGCVKMALVSRFDRLVYCQKAMRWFKGVHTRMLLDCVFYSDRMKVSDNKRKRTSFVMVITGDRETDSDYNRRHQGMHLD